MMVWYFKTTPVKFEYHGPGNVRIGQDKKFAVNRKTSKARPNKPRVYEEDSILPRWLRPDTILEVLTAALPSFENEYSL